MNIARENQRRVMAEFKFATLPLFRQNERLHGIEEHQSNFGRIDPNVLKGQTKKQRTVELDTESKKMLPEIRDLYVYTKHLVY